MPVVPLVGGYVHESARIADGTVITRGDKVRVRNESGVYRFVNITVKNGSVWITVIGGRGSQFRSFVPSRVSAAGQSFDLDGYVEGPTAEPETLRVHSLIKPVADRSSAALRAWETRRANADRRLV